MHKREGLVNKMKRSYVRAGFVFWISVMTVGLLGGCTTYVEQPPPPPPPPVAYAPPPEPEAPPPPPEATVVEVQASSDFYAPLSPYGRWVVVGSYGQVWYPTGVESGWRPYCYGHWESTDAGWYWVSDESWGWATYHYGRWVLDPTYGWIWVPQTQWAPAWVAWREGGGYCGWAPLGVTARVGVGGSFSVGIIAPSAFVFVGERNFCDPIRPTTVIVNQTTIINKTVNITKVQVVNKTVINVGPRTENIERATGRQIRPVSVNQLRRQQEAAVVARQPQLKSLQRARPESGQAQREQREQATEQERRQKAQASEERQEQKQGKGEAQKQQKAEKQQTDAERKAAAKKKKKKPQEKEQGPPREQPPAP